MRRGCLVVLALCALASCATQERPEGIVERWLLALNQGSAGEPGRYAPAQISDIVLPGWEELDPGEFDEIEAGSASQMMNVCEQGQTVPFRVVPLEGEEFSDAACVVGSRIVQLAELSGLPNRVFPSAGGPAIESGESAWWFVAAAIGIAILLAGEGVMRLTRSLTTD